MKLESESWKESMFRKLKKREKSLEEGTRLKKKNIPFKMKTTQVIVTKQMITGSEKENP